MYCAQPIYIMHITKREIHMISYVYIYTYVKMHIICMHICENQSGMKDIIVHSD